eukprot:492634_1
MSFIEKNDNLIAKFYAMLIDSKGCVLNYAAIPAKDISPKLINKIRKGPAIGLNLSLFGNDDSLWISKHGGNILQDQLLIQAAFSGIKYTISGFKPHLTLGRQELHVTNRILTDIKTMVTRKDNPIINKTQMVVANIHFISHTLYWLWQNCTGLACPGKVNAINHNGKKVVQCAKCYTISTFPDYITNPNIIFQISHNNDVLTVQSTRPFLQDVLNALNCNFEIKELVEKFKHLPGSPSDKILSFIENNINGNRKFIFHLLHPTGARFPLVIQVNNINDTSIKFRNFWDPRLSR